MKKGLHRWGRSPASHQGSNPGTSRADPAPSTSTRWDSSRPRGEPYEVGVGRLVVDLDDIRALVHEHPYLQLLVFEEDHLHPLVLVLQDTGAPVPLLSILFVSHESVLPPTFQINGEGDEAPCRNDDPDIRAIDSRLFQVLFEMRPRLGRHPAARTRRRLPHSRRTETGASP